jgi:hypothetical protein
VVNIVTNCFLFLVFIVLIFTLKSKSSASDSNRLSKGITASEWRLSLNRASALQNNSLIRLGIISLMVFNRSSLNFRQELSFFRNCLQSKTLFSSIEFLSNLGLEIWGNIDIPCPTFSNGCLSASSTQTLCPSICLTILHISYSHRLYYWESPWSYSCISRTIFLLNSYSLWENSSRRVQYFRLFELCCIQIKTWGSFNSQICLQNVRSCNCCLFGHSGGIRMGRSGFIKVDLFPIVINSIAYSISIYSLSHWITFFRFQLILLLLFRWSCYTFIKCYFWLSLKICN